MGGNAKCRRASSEGVANTARPVQSTFDGAMEFREPKRDQISQGRILKELEWDDEELE